MTSTQEISRLFTTVKQFASVIKMADGNLRRSSTKRQIRDRTSSRHRARVRSVETEITSETTRLSRSSREYRSAARLLSSPLSAARLLSSPLSAARLLSSPLSAARLLSSPLHLLCTRRIPWRRQASPIELLWTRRHP